MKSVFHKKYEAIIEGTISCYDRVIINGTMPLWQHPKMMELFLATTKIQFMEYTKFAESIKDQIIEHITQVSVKNNVAIKYIASPRNFNKEQAVKQIIQEKQITEGIVAIFSELDITLAYKSNWNYQTKRGSIHSYKPKCLHYYIYFIDKYLGLCFFRIPTWLPCRVQVYFNGHNLLARKLTKAGISYTLEDNVFTHISNYPKAQELSDDLRAQDLHKWLDVFAMRYLPFLKQYQQSPVWTIDQAEYATDIIFKNKEDFKFLYDELILRSIHTVKPGNIATFFNRALAAHYTQEVTTRYNNMIQGTRIKHSIGANSVKMYDKAPGVLRIETTVNDLRQFKINREVHTRQGTTIKRMAEMKLTIYSLYALTKEVLAVNKRYLNLLASYDDTTTSKKELSQMTAPVIFNGRSAKGFNPFYEEDRAVLMAVRSGDFTVDGIRNKTLRKMLKERYSSPKISRILKRLVLHGLLKRIEKSFKYHLTELGNRIIATGLFLSSYKLMPILNKAS